MLKEESYVDGCFRSSRRFILYRNLTEEFVEKAWELFLQIQEAVVLMNYEIWKITMPAIEEVYNERIEKVKTRKHSLIGTNIYANPADQLQTDNKSFICGY